MIRILLFSLFLGFATLVIAQDNIRLNQLGFFPNSSKTAIITNSDATSFEIVQNGQVVYQGSLTSSDYWSQSAENVRIADFTNFNIRGTYQLKLPDGSISYPFKISDDAIRSLAIGSVKAYYYNRASIELEETYAGEYKRATGHPDDQVIVLPSAATESRPAGTIISTPKGWYDAGDYNKYIVNSGISTFTLLSAYENYPAFWKNLSLNIPESNNSIPDILDEALWNIEWMATMQDEDGGVYNKTTHANFQGAVMPEAATASRYVVAKGTAAALDFAGVMAMAARVYQPYFPELSETWLAQAIAAWEWGKANSNLPYTNPPAENGYPAVNTGGYGDGNFDDEFFWAACELAITTNDTKYYSEINLSRYFGVPGWPNVETLGLLSLVTNRKQIADQMDTTLIKTKLLDITGNILAYQSESSPYRIPFNDFYWGSNSVPGNQGMLLIKAFELTQDTDYFSAAQSALDYLLGRNATGYCYVTGFGDKSPQNIHHRQSQSDGIAKPVPGFLVGGPNPQNTDDCGNNSYPTSLPAKCYLDDWCSYSTNEITINWNAPLVFLSGALDYLYQKHFWTEGEEIILQNTSQSLPSICPNPASDQIIIKGMNGFIHGSIQNISGQHIMDFTSSTVDISKLNKGFYLIEIHCNKEMFIQKLVVN